MGQAFPSPEALFAAGAEWAAARASQAEPDEWGVMVGGSCPRVVRYSNNRASIEASLETYPDDCSLVERVAAGPWLPCDPPTKEKTE